MCAAFEHLIVLQEEEIWDSMTETGNSKLSWLRRVMERRICPLCKTEKDLFSFEEPGKAKLETEISSGYIQMRR